MRSDVVVAGGSVAGLLCAREVASRGFSVTVIEEDYEIGTPEHCGGLVSMAGLGDLGVSPFKRIFDHTIKYADIQSPGGRGISIDSSRQDVIGISRRELDKQIAFQAQKSGAVIMVGTRFQKMTEDGIKTSNGQIDCSIFVDARGASSLINKDRTGILPSAQYEVYADWIKKGRVEVILDQEKYPGFFAWVIPSGKGWGKVGVAGRGINAAQVIEEILNKRGGYSTIRKIFAPVWIKGPIKKFVEGKTVIIGDAAGQAKPTTAGGIYTSGMGGVYAGQAIAKFLKTKVETDLEEYQQRWNARFGKEFERQLLARRVLERLDNDTIDRLFESVAPKIINEISKRGGFDFHAESIVRLLGVTGSAKVVHILAGRELKKLLS